MNVFDEALAANGATTRYGRPPAPSDWAFWLILLTMVVVSMLILGS